MTRDALLQILATRLERSGVFDYPAPNTCAEIAAVLLDELDELPGGLFLTGREDGAPADPDAATAIGYDVFTLPCKAVDDWSTAEHLADLTDKGPGEWWVRRYVVIDERVRRLPAPAPLQAEALPL